MFSPLIKQLRPDFDPLVVTYPVSNLLNYSDLYELISEKLPKEAKFIILGESFSGPLAIQIAASKPKNLVGVILCATFFSNPRPCLKPFIFFLLLAIRYFPVNKWGIHVLLFNGEVDPQLSLLLGGTLKKVPQSTLAHRLKNVFSVNVRDLLDQIEVPILCIFATKDRLVLKDEFKKYPQPITIGNTDSRTPLHSTI